MRLLLAATLAAPLVLGVPVASAATSPSVSVSPSPVAEATVAACESGKAAVRGTFGGLAGTATVRLSPQACPGVVASLVAYRYDGAALFPQTRIAVVSGTGPLSVGPVSCGQVDLVLGTDVPARLTEPYFFPRTTLIATAVTDVACAAAPSPTPSAVGDTSPTPSPTPAVVAPSPTPTPTSIVAVEPMPSSTPTTPPATTPSATAATTPAATPAVTPTPVTASDEPSTPEPSAEPTALATTRAVPASSASALPVTASQSGGTAGPALAHTGADGLGALGGLGAGLLALGAALRWRVARRQRSV